MIQPGVSSESWRGASDGRRVEHLAALSERVMESQARPDLLVWPEGSLPMYPDADRQRRLYQRLASWTDLQGTALLTGALTRPVSAPDPIAVDGSDPFAVRSSALLFQGESKPQQYDKVHLVSVMERVPVERRVATPGAPRPNVEQRFLPEPFEAGTQIQPVTLRGASPARIGTLMGFESLMSSHARAFVASGAEVLVTMTQNGAWGDAPSYAQHVALTRLRAVETRRAVVMAATSGASGLIYADGYVRAGVGLERAGAQQLPGAPCSAAPRSTSATATGWAAARRCSSASSRSRGCWAFSWRRPRPHGATARTRSGATSRPGRNEALSGIRSG